MKSTANLKIFIGGVPRTVTEHDFGAYFNTFGNIQGCLLMKDGLGVPRGFGFVTCGDQDTYDKIFRSELSLCGKKLESKKAVPQGQVDNESSNVKLFVGGIAPQIETAELHSFFSKFGDVADAIVMLDTMTGKSRGFGFVTFKEESSAEEVLKNPKFELGGRFVQCKRAQSASTLNRMNRASGRGSGMNARGVGSDIRGYRASMYSVNYSSGYPSHPAPPMMTGYGQPLYSELSGRAPPYISKYGSVPQYVTGYGNENAQRIETQQGIQDTQSQIMQSGSYQLSSSLQASGPQPPKPVYRYQPATSYQPASSPSPLKSVYNQQPASNYQAAASPKPLSSNRPASGEPTASVPYRYPGNVQGYANQGRYQPY